MTRFARLLENTVVEIIELPAGVSVDDAFHPVIAATIRSCGPNVEQGWIVDGQTLKAPPPQSFDPMPLTLSFLDFMDLFTEGEQLAIVGATITDAPTKLWYDRAVGAQFIDYADPRLAAGLQALVDGNLLTPARRDRVLVGLPPED
ncbi:hypothetical protein AB4Z40_08870 [Bosea sp. 2YAB26]|uniref:hypothetical protein n=1 Tax=Bosea sp. 2YAB26 TaxID=3237478 RepID=UPI003F921729